MLRKGNRDALCRLVRSAQHQYLCPRCAAKNQAIFAVFGRFALSLTHLLTMSTAGAFVVPVLSSRAANARGDAFLIGVVISITRGTSSVASRSQGTTNGTIGARLLS